MRIRIRAPRFADTPILRFALLSLLLASPALASQTVHRHLEPETVVYNALPSAAQTQFTTNENIKAVKYGSGITLASVTANFSLVDGTAFVTNPSVDLRPYVGFKLTTNEASVGYLKAKGTGETLDVEKITDPGFDNAPSWTVQAGWTVNGSNATAVNTTLACYQTTPSVTSGALYRGVTTIVSVTGSAIPVVANLAGVTDTTPGVKIDYYVSAITGTGGTFGISRTGTMSGVFSDFSVKQVLTPSTSGVTVVNSAGGSTYNWVTKGTTPNAASFTFTFTRN